MPGAGSGSDFGIWWAVREGLAFIRPVAREDHQAGRDQEDVDQRVGQEGEEGPHGSSLRKWGFILMKRNPRFEERDFPDA